MDKYCKGWVKTKQVSAVRWKVSSAVSYKKRAPDGKLAECAPLPNERVRRRRKVELDERKEIRSDLIWKH